MAPPPPTFPIIDSHIHLYPEAELSSFGWYPDSPLGKAHGAQRSIDQYAAAAGDGFDAKDLPATLRGFVFIETCRNTGDDGKDWSAPLQEIAWLRRIVTGQPHEGQGHRPEHARHVAAIVPWAPLHLGPAELAKYLAAAEEEAGPDTWKRVKGFRHLLQWAPNGTGLTDDFIASLKLLGRRGFVFDVGVDHHRRGRIQLEECVEMIDRAHEDVPEEEQVVFVLNHLCKPDLSIINTVASPAFIAWRTAMFTLAKSKKTYMKLSGCFSEMPESLSGQSSNHIFEAIFPWLVVVLSTFKPPRIMFGSDWPVCATGMADANTPGAEGGAWKKWRKIVERMCYMTTMDEEDQRMIWAGTAMKAYGIEEESA